RSQARLAARSVRRRWLWAKRDSLRGAASSLPAPRPARVARGAGVGGRTRRRSRKQFYGRRNASASLLTFGAVAEGSRAPGVVYNIFDSLRSRASTASVLKRRRTELMLTKGRARACVRFVRRIKTRSLFGSTQELVPVKPRWPKDSGGSSGPAVESGVAASCQAKERASLSPSVMFVRKSEQVAGASSRVLRGRNCSASRSVSRAVEKSPAWPAAPPRKYAFPSCTSPQMGSVRQFVVAPCRAASCEAYCVSHTSR